MKRSLLLIVFVVVSTLGVHAQFPSSFSRPLFPSSPVVPSYTAPVVPSYTAPVVPSYTAPVVPSYTAPVVPSYTAPVVPSYTAPVVPSYTAPVSPVFRPASSSIITSGGGSLPGGNPYSVQSANNYVQHSLGPQINAQINNGAVWLGTQGVSSGLDALFKSKLPGIFIDYFGNVKPAY